MPLNKMYFCTDIGLDRPRVSLYGNNSPDIDYPLERDIFADSVCRGQITNSKKYMDAVSLLTDMVDFRDSPSGLTLKSYILYIVSRQNIPAHQRDILRKCSDQILFDNCIFTSHERVVEKMSRKNISVDQTSFRCYDTEICVHSPNSKLSKLKSSPNMISFALKKFLEDKYGVIADDSHANSILSSYSVFNPGTIGKRLIKFPVVFPSKKDEFKNQTIEVEYHEVTDAIRPSIRLLIQEMGALSGTNNTTKISVAFCLSVCRWLEDLLRSNAKVVNPDFKYSTLKIPHPREILYSR